MNNPVPQRPYLLTTTACLLAFASQAAAQSFEQSLEQRLAKLEQQVDASQQSQTGSSGKSSVYDLIKNGSASYEPGRGLTFSAQDAEAFSINIGGQIQAGWTYGDDDPTNASSSNFAVRSSRIRLSGNVVNKDVTYFVQMDPNLGGNNLVDGWAGWRMHENINLRIGQQKMRSSLQGDTSMADTDLETIDRSIATTTFASQRSTGALIEGRALENKLNWHAGLMNNGTAGLDGSAVPTNSVTLVGLAAPGAQPNQAGQNELGWTAGASYGSEASNSENWSEGDLAHTGAIQWIAGATITQANETVAAGGDAMTINLFGGIKTGSGLAGQFEYFMRDNDNLNRDDSGFYGQVSYTLPKKEGYAVQWGGVLRYSTVDFDGPEATEIAAGINGYYAAHNLKTQLQLRNIQFDNAAGVEVSDTLFFDVLFTLVF